MHFKVGAISDAGRKRTQNQDSFHSSPEMGLFIVADGMGGHQGGQTASRTAIEAISTYVKNTLSNKALHPEWEAARLMIDAIRNANDTIFKLAITDPTLEGMGTTTTALIFKDEKAYAGHVGDSRCYLYRASGLWQITRDHSLVQEKLSAGLITREQLKTDQMKNVITRSVGFEPQVRVETYELDVRPEDFFLLCSDGLSGLIEDSNLLEIIEKCSKEQLSPQKAVEELTALANQNGGDDNITALLIQILG